MNLVDELQKLQRLHESGALTDEEFSLAKARLLSPPPEPPAGTPGGRGWNSDFLLGLGAADEEQATRRWAMLLHLSQLANCLFPLAGMLAPILIWQLKKKDLPGLDAHGLVVANWMISELLYLVVGFLLMYLFVGLPLLLVLVSLGVIFPILGGIKANNGELWPYPLSIRFLK